MRATCCITMEGPAMKKRSSITAPSDLPKLDLAGRYLRLKHLRQIVREAERLRLSRGVELKAPGSRINPQPRNQA
jgi:hypothetical protein